MWNNVLLTESYGRSIIKSALKSGDLTFTSPAGKFEKEQIERIKKEVNRSRLVSDALLYSLLFNSVILDSNTYGTGHVFIDPDDLDIVESIPVFNEVSDSFITHFQSTNPLEESFGYSVDGRRHHKVSLSSSEQERVELYRLLEPYVWNRVKDLGPDRINRNVMNDILSILQSNSEILFYVRDRDLSSKLDYLYFDDLFGDFWNLYPRKMENVEYFHRTIELIDTKASVAIAKVQEAQRLDAALPIKNITNRKGNLSNVNCLKSQDGDLLVSVKMVLNEFKYFPVLRSITDVLKLKEDPSFIEFRGFINKWVCAVTNGDKETEKLLRLEIEKSNKSISKAHQCQKTGRFITYMGIPITSIDLIFGIPVGIALTSGGVTVQGYSDKLMSSEKWLLIGQKK